MTRAEKYEDKLDGEVLKARADAYAKAQASLFKLSQVEQVTIEIEVGKLVTDYNVRPLWKIYYIEFARQCVGLVQTIRGEQLFDEIEALEQIWRDRGLEDILLEAIKIKYVPGWSDHMAFTLTPGFILPYYHVTVGGDRPPAPDGWLYADGSAVSRTTYADLFAAFGTKFGAGDGSTTFNLPDMTSTYVKGWDVADPESTGDKGGAEDHDHTIGAGTPLDTSEVSAGTPTGTIPPHGTISPKLGTMVNPILFLTEPPDHQFIGDPLPVHKHTVSGETDPADHNPPYILLYWLIKT